MSNIDKVFKHFIFSWFSENCCLPRLILICIGTVGMHIAKSRDSSGGIIGSKGDTQSNIVIRYVWPFSRNLGHSRAYALLFHQPSIMTPWPGVIFGRIHWFHSFYELKAILFSYFPFIFSWGCLNVVRWNWILCCQRFPINNKIKLNLLRRPKMASGTTMTTIQE